MTHLTKSIVTGMNAGGEQFLEGTLAAVLPVIWLILGLHLGRPYILDNDRSFHAAAGRGFALADLHCLARYFNRVRRRHEFHVPFP